MFVTKQHVVQKMINWYVTTKTCLVAFTKKYKTKTPLFFVRFQEETPGNVCARLQVQIVILGSGNV